jgi:hypothetical protein
MLTLILTRFTGINVPEIIGYILSGAEILLVLLGILRCFVPPTTKFGKWLRWSASALSEFLRRDPEEKEDSSNPKEDDEQDKEA